MDLQDIRAVGPDEAVEADVCIVGSGPAGLTIARELGGSGARTLLVESGGLDPDPWSDALNEIESVGAPRVMDQTLVRNRIFGGTSSTWSGRCAVFDEMDFEKRDWVPHSGWPLKREQITKYLPRTLPYLGIFVADNVQLGKHFEAAEKDAGRPKFDHTLLQDYYWSFSSDPANHGDYMRFGERALREHPPGLRCLINATVTQIETDQAGSAVQSLEVAGRDGSRRRIRARFYVLCAGGIENARMLLASRRNLNCGIGNKTGLVGRYLMDHPRGVIGHFRAQDFIEVQRLFSDYRGRIDRHKTGLVYGVALSPTVQRNEELLNCAVWITGSRAPEDPWLSLKSILRERKNLVRNSVNVLRNAGIVAESLKRYAMDHRGFLMRMNDIALSCIVEQRPDPDSRVMLADRTDELGVPLARIDWRINEQEIRTVRRIGHLIVEESNRLGLPAPELTDMIRDPSANFLLPDVAHPTGTTRMADSEGSGVVDTDCAVHGVSGLYIAGSSTFPTSGHANPTQMIVAMAIRLADHLKEKLKASSTT